MKKVVFTFGRMNPVSANHEIMVNKVLALARTLEAEPRVYLSHTQNETTDLLSYPEKLEFARESFGVVIKQSDMATILDVAKTLAEEGVQEITFVAGSDKVERIRGLLEDSGIKFSDINVISAGILDPDEDASRIMRDCVIENDRHTFMNAAPTRMDNTLINEMFELIRSRIPVIEEIPEAEAEENFNESFEIFFNEKDALQDLMNQNLWDERIDNPPPVVQEELYDDLQTIPESTDIVEADSNESTMAGFACILLHSRTVVHLMHLRSRSYSVHVALKEFYSKIPDLVDSLVESYQGKYGMLVSFPESYQVKTDDPVQYITQLGEFVYGWRAKLPQDSELQNEIDSIAALINTILYKLRYLG